VGFVLLVLIIIVMFLRTETGAELTARLRSLFPSAPETSAPPLTTRWPPVIAYGSIGDRKNHVVVDIGLINNASTAIGVSILTKAVVRPVPKNSDEESSVAQALKDEIHARTAGVRTVTITVPAHDSSLRFVIPGPEVSQARRADIDAGREDVYFYALMQVRLGRASYFSAVCGRGSGTHVQQCAPELRRP
jgi:Na+-transporting methylmalonyl-CoA/oxaloacetate decarboxylase gamma subunit